MPDISRIFYLLALVFLLMGLVSNILPNWPKLPGDMYFDKGGFKIYIPFTSAIIISVILTLVLNFLRK
ncbi:MAG: hypothetical protein ACD_30C00051G0006 [uncultured bacterium]|uniref:DUF2905 domain-containing protein n=2 Tax=Candidatus Daviesiibacteriota TaxID=1752718 RepID=A0A1F5K3E3_9BACT|nr:MAG: hypothetical protein ACD_30C00051G0006 [uncultured bacterium]OGE16417.1 MAG: hypothetical protein A2858_01605 [Candidatus Daviesbacteria bacterium RIFCSPHIGHO2_01_FULL_36_37]OGE35334.1 MAG: hypothetical protein A3E66_00590 [Candidatus Daviesbacteria bacterium RIFCSPHIGHO2_12_FULL_37_16]